MAGASSLEPQWSPDGKRIAFFSSRALNGTDVGNTNQTFNIWLVNADGTGLFAITRLTVLGAGSFSPRWSPDGTRIVFYSRRALDGTDAASTNGTSNIWRVRPDATDLLALTNLTAFGADSFSPEWSPDAVQIVFSSRRALNGADAANANNTFNIWRLNANGTGLAALTALTATGASSGGPQWSPDGARIAFDSARALSGTDASAPNNTANIWRIETDGTGAAPLTAATAVRANSFGVRWLRSGNGVVFNSARAIDGADALNATGIPNVWRVKITGQGLAAITDGTAENASSVAPDVNP
jgi:Tol biopolymer transport system component